MERGHRRVFYATEGSATLPGRFAIDFMKLDERGKLSSGDADIPASHHGFGAEVLAVADGTIVAVRDDVPGSEEHTSELQSLMRNSYAVFCLKTKKQKK